MNHRASDPTSEFSANAKITSRPPRSVTWISCQPNIKRRLSPCVHWPAINSTTYVVLEQVIQSVIGAGQTVHNEHDGAQADVQQRLHGGDLRDQDDWVPLGVAEAGLHGRAGDYGRRRSQRHQVNVNNNKPENESNIVCGLAMGTWLHCSVDCSYHVEPKQIWLKSTGPQCILQQNSQQLTII